MPAGPPQVLLDGWGYQDTHETLNTFIWGPDGWLYGSHGVFTHSNVGKPGTPDAERMPLNAGDLALPPDEARSSRSSPTARATRGASTSTTTARPSRPPASSRTSITSIQGARYKRQAGKHFNPYTYDDIKTDRRPRALGRHDRDRTPATADRTRPAAATRTPAR